MIEIEGLGHLMSLVKKKDVITVIDFYADWCGPCQKIKPMYERMQTYYDPNEVVFTKCNVDRNKDCATQFKIQAMPTFVVCRDGETLYEVRGDISLLQRQIDLSLNYMKSTMTQARSNQNASSEGTKVTGNNEFAVTMMKLAVAEREKDAITAKELSDKAYSLLTEDAEHEAGVLLIPYLASQAFTADALEALLKNISLRGNTQRYDGESFIHQVLRFLIDILSNLSWKDMNMVQLCTRVVVSLSKCYTAGQMMVESPFFDNHFILSGEQLERQTLLGALLGVGPIAKPTVLFPTQRAMARYQVLLALFPPSEMDHSTKLSELKNDAETFGDIVNRAVQQLLKGKITRQATLLWLGKAMELNDAYFKTMHEEEPLSSFYFMCQLLFIAVDAALPIFKGTFDYSKLPPCYLLGGDQNPVVVHFGEDVERIAHYDKANPCPKCPDNVENYKPIVHLFFISCKAVMFYASFIDMCDSSSRQSTHPQASVRDRAVFNAKTCEYKIMLETKKWAVNRVQLVNFISNWLLHVMKVQSSGKLPANVPVEWNYLPQQLVDSVVRATQRAPKDSLFVDGLISLMLVLMGNVDYFPKPHTHVLFPSFLLELMNNYETKRVLESHVWYGENIVRDCIKCYIAVEKSIYEKVQVRYELSYCLKEFLQIDSLCDPVREEFGASGTVLEKFSHMAVAEVNEAVDQLISTVTKMNEKVKAGADLSENAVAAPTASSSTAGGQDNNNGRARNRNADGSNRISNEQESSESDEEPEEGNETYDQLGKRLRSFIMLFNASIDMFIQLSQQFPKGVSQNMVALQISQMLCRSLVCFAGPKNKTLKIEFADRYEYHPKQILARLVDCLTHFRRSRSFLKCVCECGVSLDEIKNAMETVVRRQLVSETLTWKLSEMIGALDKVYEEVDKEEALWNDAPDFALDALLSTPLLHPVALPSDVKDLEDLVYVNRDTIHHMLLSDPKHPTTREYLDEKMVDDFNNKPEVAAARRALEEKIAAWLKEAKEKA